MTCLRRTIAYWLHVLAERVNVPDVPRHRINIVHTERLQHDVQRITYDLCKVPDHGREATP